MIVVSDTSPIINLAAIGQLELIPALFHQVVIPPAVFHEIVVQGAGLPGSTEIQQASWIEVQACSDLQLLASIKAQKDIHPGEAEALCLALELHAEAILLDDAAGRDLARSYRLPFIGVLGILLKAKNLGHISAVRPLMDQLQAEADFYIHKNLFLEVLRLAGEN